eukprot:g1531.t1
MGRWAILLCGVLILRNVHVIGGASCDQKRPCRAGEYHPGEEPACPAIGCLPYCSNAGSEQLEAWKKTPFAETNLLFIVIDYPDKIHDYRTAARKVFDAIKNDVKRSKFLLLKDGMPSDLTVYTQIWLWDVSPSTEGSNANVAAFHAIADWYLKRKSETGKGEIISDARILSSVAPGPPGYIYPPHCCQIYKNYVYNLRMRGGGLVLGTDDDLFQDGINIACERLGIQKYSGKIESINRMSVDDESPIFSKPADCAQRAEPSEYARINGKVYTKVVPDYTTTGISQANNQPNGMFFFAIGFHKGDISKPGISSTIRGSLNLQVKIDGLQCNECVKEGFFTASATIVRKTKGPYTFSWRYKRLSAANADFVVVPGSTAKMASVPDSALVKVAPYLIEASVRDSSPGVAVVARASVKVQYRCSVDCKVSQWSAFTACPKGGGKRRRSRKILVQQDGNGKACDGLTEERECVDCRVSKWGRTQPCTIGSLSTLRKRRVLEPAKFGGKACPSLSQSRPCMWEKEEVCMHSCDGYVLGKTLRPASGKRPDGMNTIVMYFKTDPEGGHTDFHLFAKGKGNIIADVSFQRLLQLQTVNASTARYIGLAGGHSKYRVDIPPSIAGGFHIGRFIGGSCVNVAIIEMPSETSVYFQSKDSKIAAPAAGKANGVDLCVQVGCKYGTKEDFCHRYFPPAQIQRSVEIVVNRPLDLNMSSAFVKEIGRALKIGRNVSLMKSESSLVVNARLDALENLISKVRIMNALSNATIGGIAIVQIKFPEGSADENSYFHGKDGDDNQVKGGNNAESAHGKDSAEMAQDSSIVIGIIITAAVLLLLLLSFLLLAGLRRRRQKNDNRNFIVNPFAEAEAEAQAETEMTNMQQHYDDNAWEVENEYFGYAMNDHVDEGQYETMYD